MVVVDKTKTTLKKADFENGSERTQRVGAMMQQTITQIYQSISENIKAANMKVGERLTSPMNSVSNFILQRSMR